jgi:hypothetical protein
MPHTFDGPRAVKVLSLAGAVRLQRGNGEAVRRPHPRRRREAAPRSRARASPTRATSAP